MNFKPLFCLMVGVALVLAASEARAAPFFYDVDSLTLPGGPFTLENGVITPVPDTNLYTLSGNVVNTSPNTFHNVEFLNEFVFDTPSDSAATDLPFSGGSWSATIDSATDTLTTSGTPAGTLEMLPSNTNVPLYSGILDGTSGTLLSTDSPPYFTVGTGTILGGTSTPFSETVQETNASFPMFDLRGSFISTDPVPEPSTLILAGFGAIGLCAVGRRRKRLFVSQG